MAANRWIELIEQNPEHSSWYIERFRSMAAAGDDLAGEARLIDAMVPRGARILDAGCGTGRLGGYLAARGHDVVGTDIDPVLIEHARRDHPDARWEVGDLSVDPVPVSDVDVAVSAGNVMGFLAPEGREAALRNIAGSLAADGRFVVGFGAGRGWGFDDFIATAERVGLELENVFESWDLHPFTADSDFLVAIFRNDADG